MIQDKDLGKYRRPGIFINEIDASIVQLPVQDVLINLVPGFSKKGPVNNPTYVTNKTDFIKIFGDIDKSLERKSSYFHRTCMKMLESGPIWALNLLTTDDTRDFINWETISLSSFYDNNPVQTDMPYSRVFNRQDFWKRDSESFLDYANDQTQDDNTKILHITNLGDKTITSFMFKSSATGFNVSSEDWYGGATKVPAYIHPKDWISDYLITLVVLEGNWSDYNTLSVDSKWSKYFDKTGLIKTNIENFLNESNVTVLAYYDASIIPYFKDLNGKNMYVKTLINGDTDKTGLFCAFNEDVLLDSDVPTDALDIIGSTMVNTDKKEINFLSYQENITESVTYNLQNLNDNGNVFGNYAVEMNTDFTSDSGRFGDKTNGYINGTTVRETESTLVNVHAIKTGPYSGTWLDIALNNSNTNGGFNYPQVPFEAGDAVYFTESMDNGQIVAYKTYYIIDSQSSNNQILISDIKGGTPLLLDNSDNIFSTGKMYIIKCNVGLDFGVNPYFNIGGTSYTFNTGATDLEGRNVEIEPLVVSFTALSALTSSAERYDLLYLPKGNDATINVLKGTQSTVGTATLPKFNLTPSDYILVGYVKLYTSNIGGFKSQSIAIISEYNAISLDSNGYVPFANITCSAGIDAGTNYVHITFGNTSGGTNNSDYTKIRTRQAFSEIENTLDNFKGVIINKTTGNKLPITASNFASASYSTATNAFIDINVGTDNASNYFSGATNTEFLFYYLDNEFMIDGITNRLFTSLESVAHLTTDGQTVSQGAGVIGKYSQLYLDYYNGVINNGDYFYINNNTGSTQEFFKMWFQGTDLYIDVVNADGDTGDSIEDFTSLYSSKLVVTSKDSNYTQTVEIESLDISKLYTHNVYEISVDKVRYSEVAKGSFLEGYYSTSTDRKLVRVIQTIPDPNNANNKIVKTDGPIAINTIIKVGGGEDYSTTAYPSIDIYVSTYKGVTLAPFKMSVDSMPLPNANMSAAEARQSEILDVISQTTNLAKGLVNKNKISWRYLIDSFGLGLTTNSKQQLVDLCGMKLNCLGFINIPSVKQLKKSDNPSFINTDLTLNTFYLKEGGNLDKSPSFLYTFGTGAGATCVGYFMPYLTIDDNGTPMSFPPSSFACTTYMTKFLTNQAGIHPWTISAGISDGKVRGVGDTEMDFSDEQLEDLYAMGANPIVKKLNNGFCINSESTAKQFPFSSLSFLHSREVLIELENSLYDMLLRYQWKFNTPEVRAEIKYKADKICKDLQTSNALYNFKNVIDETNNTNYIIDLQMGVLETYIEIIKGMSIIVNNITILKKGDIESGGFM